MPVVTIVTTTLNRAHYLEQAIESALSQTFVDFEILVCDDGGHEATKRVCESFHDKRIRHIVNHSALGIAMNTYAGVMHARSELVAFLNDDDRWTPKFLEECVPHLLEYPHTALVFSDHWLIGSDGSRLVSDTDANSRTYGRDSLDAGYVAEPMKLLARNSIPLAMASVFRKSAVNWDLYSSQIEGTYDYFLSYCLLRSGGRIFYVPERLTEYRVHGESATAKFSLTNSLGSAYVNNLILRDPQFHSIANDIRRKCISIESHLAKIYLRRLSLVLALKHFVKSMQHRIA